MKTSLKYIAKSHNKNFIFFRQIKAHNNLFADAFLIGGKNVNKSLRSFGAKTYLRKNHWCKLFFLKQLCMADFCLLELVLPQGPGPVLYRIVQLCQGQSKLEQFILRVRRQSSIS